MTSLLQRLLGIKPSENSRAKRAPAKRKERQPVRKYAPITPSPRVQRKRKTSLTPWHHSSAASSDDFGWWWWSASQETAEDHSKSSHAGEHTNSHDDGFLHAT